jgi:hypothetical protein
MTCMHVCRCCRAPGGLVTQGCCCDCPSCNQGRWPCNHTESALTHPHTQGWIHTAAEHCAGGKGAHLPQTRMSPSARSVAPLSTSPTTTKHPGWSHTWPASTSPMMRVACFTTCCSAALLLVRTRTCLRHQ